MTRSTSTLKFVMLVAGVSLVLVGLAAVAVGAVLLTEGNDSVRLTVVEGPEVPIPEESTLLGGSVTVYTPERPTKSPSMLDCELIESDGEPASGTRVGNFTFALSDPVTVDGATWYPLTEIELRSESATLRCPGGDLSTVALSQESTFGRSTTLIGAVAVGAGLLGLVLGSGGLLVARAVRR